MMSQMTLGTCISACKALLQRVSSMSTRCRINLQSKPSTVPNSSESYTSLSVRQQSRNLWHYVLHSCSITYNKCRPRDRVGPFGRRLWWSSLLWRRLVFHEVIVVLIHVHQIRYCDIKRASETFRVYVWYFVTVTVVWATEDVVGVDDCWSSM